MAITHLIPSDPALDVLDSLAAELAAQASRLEVECLGADRERALLLAEAVEVLARRVGQLQLMTARAVDVAAPAPSGGPARTAGAGAVAGTGDSGKAEVPAPFRRARDLLRDRLRISGAEASRRIRLAAGVTSTVAITGEVLPPTRTRLSEAVPEISLESARVVVRAVERVGAVLGNEQSEVLEALLVGYAATFDPDQLTRIADRAVALADPDGAEPHVSVAQARQGVHIGPTRQGLTTIRLVVDALQLEVLRTVFDAGTSPRVRKDWSEPGRSEPGGSESGGLESGSAGDGASVAETAAGPVAAADGASVADADVATEVPFDPRTRPQLMLDALVAAAGCALRSQVLPPSGGTPTQVVVTIDAAQLCDALGQRADVESHPGEGWRTRDEGRSADPPDWERRWREGVDSGARLTHAGPVPFRLVRRLACDADVLPVVLGTDGRVLDLGTSHRLFPVWMRRALAARDGGCAFPGCSVPSTWCEAHHIVPWYRGGVTSVANGVLLCPYHHHLVDDEHWVVVGPHRGGRVRFEPARAGAATAGLGRRAGPNRFHTG